MKFSLFIFTLLFLPIAICAKYVAVLETLADPAAKDIVSLSDRTYLTDVLRSEAVKILPAEQNFTIMTRENISAMLPPGKSIEDCEGSCLAETGRNISADYVAQARVGMFGGSLTLSVEIYETAGNKLIAGFNGDGESVKDLLAIVKRDSPDFFKKVKGSSTAWGGATGFSDVSNGGNFALSGAKSFIVEVSTVPAGAAISIDGRPITKCMQTPCKIQVEEGEHRFVAVKEHYEDGEMVVSISAENKKVNLNLASNTGTLVLEPTIGEVGSMGELSLLVDGKAVKQGAVDLDPGIHDIQVTHPCYDPIEFKVGIEKAKVERFDQALVRGVGGLKLDAEQNGEPLALPVYVDGREVGSTPFLGEVPLCAKVAVGEGFELEEVKVDLRWHETVEFTHKLGSAVKTGESVDPGVKSDKAGIKWLPVGISAAVAVAGTVLAFIGESSAKSTHDKVPADDNEYAKNKDEIHSAQTLRMVGIVTAIVGAVGVGVSFAF